MSVTPIPPSPHARALSLREPAAPSPVLVEVPHAGLGVDAEAIAWMDVPLRCLAHDADLYVDELFADAPDLGATLLVAGVSRYVVDLNRAADDFDGRAVEGGPAQPRPRGVVWRTAGDGSPVVRRPMPRAEFERRMTRYHRPYHDRIAAILTEKRRRFGFAVMLCAHSMPTPRRQPAHADLVPGTQGRTSAGAHWIDLVDRVGRDHGWTIAHDRPYRGGYSTRHYGRPSDGFHVIQVEIARRLYMDERTMERRPEGFAAVQAFAGDLTRSLVKSAHAVYRDQRSSRAGDGTG